MAKGHPALQELFKTQTGMLQSPLLYLPLLNISQCFPLGIQTTSWMESCSRHIALKERWEVCFGHNLGACSGASGCFRLASAWVLPCYVYIMWYNIISQKTCSILRPTRWAQPDYSIKPEDHGRKPLFVDKGESKTMLNGFFLYLYSKVSSWQSMSELTVTTMLPWTTSRRTSWILLVGPFPYRNLDPTCLKCQVCQATSLRTPRPLYPLLPSFGRRMLTSPRGLTSSLSMPFTRNHTLASADDKALSMYLHSRATAWYLRFPPVHSPYHMDYTEKVVQKDPEDPTGSSAFPAAS